MQVCDGRVQAHGLERRIGQARRPFDRVPVNFKIRSQPYPPRCTGAKDVREIHEHGLLATGGKAQIVLSNHPSATSVRYFEA